MRFIQNIEYSWWESNPRQGHIRPTLSHSATGALEGVFSLSIFRYISLSPFYQKHKSFKNTCPISFNDIIFAIQHHSEPHVLLSLYV